MRLLLPGVWTFERLRVGRAYLIEDNDGLAMVDANQYGTLPQVERELAAIGRTVDDVHTIIATHHHPDHVGAAAAIRERTGAKLYAHTLDAPVIDGRTPRPPKQWWQTLVFDTVRDAPPCPIDAEIRDGDELSAGGGLRVVHSPGHTAGHIALLDPARRVLFAGDAIANTFGLQPPFFAATDDMREARRSIHRLARFDFDHLLPGHGSPILSHAAEKVRMWASRWVESPV